MYSIDFQRSVLKLLCNNIQFAINNCTALESSYFETQPLRLLFGMISEYLLSYEKELQKNDLIILIDDYSLSRGYSIDVTTMLRSEVDEILKTAIKSEQFIIDRLINFITRQEVKKAALHILDTLKSDGDYQSCLNVLDKALSKGDGHEKGLDFQDLHNLPSLYREQYNPSTLVKLGFPSFDNALKGGMAPGEVHLIVAPPKTGKSTLACNIGAFNMVSGKIVYHITVEIKQLDVAIKYASRITGMTSDEIIGKECQKYKKKIEGYDSLKPNLFIKYWTEHTVNALGIRSWISKTRSNTGKSPGLIIVDYDEGIVPVVGSNDDMYNDAGKVYSDLIALADYFNCPIITFAQPKRDAWYKYENDELIKSNDLAHSARKAHKCFSLSSLNFKEGTDDGIFYIDIARRGLSKVKIKMRRNLSIASFKETV